MTRQSVVVLIALVFAIYMSYSVATAAEVVGRTRSGADILRHTMEHSPGFWTREKLKAAVTPRHYGRRRSASAPSSSDELQAVVKAANNPRVTCPGSEDSFYNGTRFYDGTVPFQTVGKIFFSIGENYFQCSGSISSDQRLVWTASHCTYDLDVRRYVSNAVFIPMYNDNNRPLGTYYATHVYATTPWINSASESNPNVYGDYALYEFGTSFPDSYGHFDLVVNLVPAVNTYRCYGYPAETPYDGEWVNLCQSLGCNRDNTVSPATVGITCDSNGGASGGPWLVADGNGDYTKIAGVTSYGYDTQPDVLYSAFMDSDTQDFFDNVSAGKGAPDQSSGAAGVLSYYQLLL
eukprot:TRINITY_DN1595_c0_g1_i1.p1 TRINITY_DN1595_c0_g1~~TRINITY_DN1595_c0_g1_i1.p1  ORF type:complete len:349 (+),score=28.25 TRINITY_DN1595_c0_g1_i1:145-1191(+)